MLSFMLSNVQNPIPSFLARSVPEPKFRPFEPARSKSSHKFTDMFTDRKISHSFTCSKSHFLQHPSTSQLSLGRNHRCITSIFTLKGLSFLKCKIDI